MREQPASSQPRGLQWISEGAPFWREQYSFRAFNVGLAKTGTTSVAALLSSFRSAHEYMMPQVVGSMLALQQGRITRASFEQMLRVRCLESNLSMDSTTFCWYYIDYLVSEFPDAKFVVTVRDSVSWLESFLNMLVTMAAPRPRWLMAYLNHIMRIPVSEEALGDSFRRRTHLAELIDPLLDHWATQNQHLLDAIPLSRRLVIRTHELSTSMSKLARFLQIPLDSLRTDLVRENVRSSSGGVFENFPRKELAARSEARCTTLMNRLFPPGLLPADYSASPLD